MILKYIENFLFFCPEEYKKGHYAGYLSGYEDAVEAGKQPDYSIEKLEKKLSGTNIGSFALPKNCRYSGHNFPSPPIKGAIK
ncbi:MAG TPA: hypothetical protein DDZ41_06565 [Flavobacterium sp.]|nr:hypothetical protein [Flavobacterium sp.]